MAEAVTFGSIRHAESLRARRRNRHGHTGKTSEVDHVNSACATRAVCRYYGLPWYPQVNVFHAIRNAEPLEVQYRSQEKYQLLIRGEDQGDAPFVLVRGIPPEMLLIGWIVAGHAKRRPDWMKTHGGREPAYFVPDDCLYDVRCLPLEYYQMWNPHEETP